MISSHRCLMEASRLNRQIALTFFTKEKCQLCKNARQVLDSALHQIGPKKPVLKIVDIMKLENSEAFEKYCFDVPVLHVDRHGLKKLVKFMHYFKEQELVEEMTRDIS